MNKQLLALSLVAAPGLMAQEAHEANNGHEQTGYCNTCCCSPCSCKPCCVPKPKKCIDCECYTPQFYDLQCDCGFFFDIEFLYWYSNENNVSYALRGQTVARTDQEVDSPLVFAPIRYETIDTKWNPGVRVGIGWNSECDGWDYYLNWTYYHNKAKDTTSVTDTYSFEDNLFVGDEGEQFLIDPWINQSFHSIVDVDDIVTFDKVRGKQRFTFNQVDLELGRKYWLSRCFNLRPFTALRGAWTRRDLKVNAYRDTSNTQSVFDFDFEDKFKSRNWGVGVVGGIQPTWYFCDNFALYSNMDVAVLWGEFETKKDEDYLGTQTTGSTVVTDPSYTNQSLYKWSGMSAMVDVALGIRWEEYWCCDQYRSNVDFGWEHHIWLNHNVRNQSQDYVAIGDGTQPDFNGFRSYSATANDEGFGGFVLRVRFDW